MQRDKCPAATKTKKAFPRVLHECGSHHPAAMPLDSPVLHATNGLENWSSRASANSKHTRCHGIPTASKEL